MLGATPADARFLFFGKKKVELVPATPAPQAPPPAVRPEPPLAGRATCLDVRRVAGAQFFGDDALELTLRTGARWKLYFAQSCPTLSFYAGFYYKRDETGMLCAGRDTVIARSGGECPIASIVPVRKPKAKPKPRRRR